MAQSAGLHEPSDLLDEAAIDRHRAIVSIKEELEAVDWYDQRVSATSDASLAAVLAHNRDEEKEHASMTIEWLRRHDALLDFFVELFPAFVGDGGFGAQQMVHRLTSFRLPIPRDPLSADAGSSVPASASTSASISVMGSVVNRYVRRN